MGHIQGYVSKSLVGLDFHSKYNLTEYTDLNSPLVMFGMYDADDLTVYSQHLGPVTLVWQGMDAKDLNGKVEIIKNRDAQHYAISDWITQSLNKYDIVSTYAPISATKGKANPIPRGNSVYFYTSRLSQESSDYYGEYMIDEVIKRTGLKVYVAAYDTYTKEELQDVYRDCFINLRLTTYDGCPNTNLEMGLLGRRSVFNGNIPCSIKWNGLDDVINAVMTEFYRRRESNRDVAELTEIFVNSTNNIFL